MKMKKYALMLVAILFGINTTVWGQAPLAGCWHPEFIKDWVPEKDPDRKFNRSTVPLQPRIPTAQTLKAHAEQFPEGKVAACLTMHPMCSQVPSQGANNFIGYNPTFWQYMDLLVWWGGSSGEGIILPPSAPVIDAAHMSGVKVLGQIFFPPTAFGGLPAWTSQMNSTTGNGVYPYARKCAEIAKYYGFDGWFINSETLTQTDFAGWTADYLRYAQEIGLQGQEIQIYDMSSYATNVQRGVANQVGGSAMVNYGGATNTVSAAAAHNEATGGSKFDSWYAGLEQSGSITGNGYDINNTLFRTDGHRASANFFNPEEPIWKKVVTNLLGTPNAEGTNAYTAMTRVFQNEHSFWVNTLGGDVTTTRGSSTWSFRGMATAVQERSAIQSIPFVSSFSLGLGKHRFVNGEKKGTQDWYHRGMQSVMPTWRWWVVPPTGGAKTDISFSYNWDDAYNMGTSIGLSGNLKNGAYTLNLYKTKIAVTIGDKLELVYKTNKENSIRLKIGTTSQTSTIAIKREPATTTTRNGWTVDTYDLTGIAGRNIYLIALEINPGNDNGNGFTAQLGQIGIYPAAYNPSAGLVANAHIQNDLGPTTGDLRIIWDHPSDISNIHHYNVYLTRNGETKLVGQTRNEGFYVHKFDRQGLDETALSVQVKAVYKNMEEDAQGVSVAAQYPEVGLPEVQQLTASKSLLQPGEEVTFTVTASNFPTQYTWKAPAAGTGELVSSNGNTARYKFSATGKHNVEVEIQNAKGTTTHHESNIVNVHAGTLIAVSRASNGGSVRISGGFGGGYDCNSYILASGEHPGWLIDNTEIPGGLSQKWCAGGSKEHWVIVTLDKIYELYRFRIHDCGNKENASDNLTHYKIFTSVDKINWEEVLHMQNVPATSEYNVKDHYVAPTFAKYVKFVPYDPDKAITIRIWQFDAFGMEGTPTPALTELKTNKRIAVPGEEVTFSVKATQAPTAFQWNISGATKVSQQDTEAGSTAVFTFTDEGFYDVSVTATNAGGNKSIGAAKLVQISASEKLLSLNKPVIVTSNGSGQNYLTDGVTEPTDITNRWNAKGAADYHVVIDLGKEYDITRFVTYDCRTMEPAEQLNVNHYNIFTAKTLDADGNGEWTLAVRGRNSENKNVKDDQLQAPVTARYVKLNPYDWALFETRIYEFEIYGKEKALPPPSIAEQANINLTETQSTPVEIAYNMNGNPKDPAFDITLRAEKTDVIELTEKAVAEDKVSFKVKGLKQGTSKVFVKLINGAFSVEQEFTANVLPLPTIADQAEVALKVNETTPVEIAYNMNGNPKDPAFDITLRAEKTDVIELTEKAVAEDKVSFKIKGLKEGTSKAFVTLVNGNIRVEKEFAVKVNPGTGLASIRIAAPTVYPNPVLRGANLTVKAEQAPAHYRLLSIDGVVVIQVAATGNQTTIPTTDLNPGVYFLQAADNSTQTVKIVVR